MPFFGKLSYNNSQSSAFASQNMQIQRETMPEDGFVKRVVVTAGGDGGATLAAVVLYHSGIGFTQLQTWDQILRERSMDIVPSELGARIPKGHNVQWGFWGHPSYKRRWAVHDGAGRAHWQRSHSGTAPPPASVIPETLSQVPSDLYAYVVYVANRQPLAPAWLPGSDGSDTTYVDVATPQPTLIATLGHPADEEGYDYSTLYHLRVINTTTGQTVYDATHGIGAINRANGYIAITLPTLARNNNYYAIARHKDRFDLWSPFSDARYFRIITGPEQPIDRGPQDPDGPGPGNDLVPQGRIDVLNPTYTADYTHVDGIPLTAARLRLFSEDGNVLLGDSGWLSASGTTFTRLHSTVPNFPLLDWGKRYTWDIQFRDTANAIGPVSNQVVFNTNTAPFTPTNLTPTNGLADSTGILSCTVSDPDGDQLQSVTFKLIRQSTGLPVTGYPVTVNGPFNSGQRVSLNVLPDLVLGASYRWNAYASDGVLTGSVSSDSLFSYSIAPTVDFRGPQVAGLTNSAPAPSAEFEGDETYRAETELRIKNLLTANQSSIETDATGWTAGGPIVKARSTAFAEDGSASLSLTTTLANENANQYVQVILPDLTPGETYSWQARVYCPVPAYIWGDVTGIYRTTPGLMIAATTGGNQQLPAGWSTISGTGTVPAGSTGPFLFLLRPAMKTLGGTIADSTKTIYYDKLQVEKAAAPTDWELGGTNIVRDSTAIFGLVAEESSAYGEHVLQLEKTLADGLVRVALQPEHAIPILANYCFLGVHGRKVSGDMFASLRLEALDITGSIISTISPLAHPDGNDMSVVTNLQPPWQWYGMFTDVFPAGTVSVRPYVEFSSGSSGIAQLDAFQLIFVGSAYPPSARTWFGYFDGDFVGLGPNGYEWVGLEDTGTSKGLNILTDRQGVVPIFYNGVTEKSADRLFIEQWSGTAWVPLYDSGWIHSIRREIPLPSGLIKNQTAYRVKVVVRDGGD